ncbi:MAG TPA: FHA domain-containing protein [Rhodanobacteraceae bacterium]|nr:FHA domain-containing protein [Rhodanobacteraceae bacterium]
MKLVFAGGEHVPVTLADGVTVVGAAADAGIQLAQPGIAPRHAQIERRGERVQLQPCAEPVRLNGRPVRDAIVLKAGDTVEFAGVRCRAVHAAVEAEVEDRSTRMRSALPRFVLRGVSGPTFGRSFGVAGEMVFGRQADCDVCIPISEISRRHARVKPGAEGVLVEDLDSANGTYINGKRVRSGTLRPGEELALDTVRFMLLMPGTEAVPASASSAAPSRSSGVRAVALIVLALALAALMAYFIGTW